MSTTKSKRATIYFDPALHKAVRLKALETDRSVSDVVDEAIRCLLNEDAEDLADLSARVSEPSVSFESFVKELKDAGDI
jgi:hypothetical protein